MQICVSASQTRSCVAVWFLLRFVRFANFRLRSLTAVTSEVHDRRPKDTLALIKWQISLSLKLVRNIWDDAGTQLNNIYDQYSFFTHCFLQVENQPAVVGGPTCDSMTCDITALHGRFSALKSTKQNQKKAVKGLEILRLFITKTIQNN